MTVTRKVSAFVAGLELSSLSEQTVRTTKQVFLDSIACMVGGARTFPGRVVAGMVRRQAGRPESTLVGWMDRVPATGAILANATAANALDYDDTLFGHPGATTVPVVLATCELTGSDGATAIAATVAAYEVAVRLTACTEPMIVRYRDMWDLGTMQAFGSAVAAGRVLGLDAERMEHALGLVSATAPVPLPRKPRELAYGRSMIKSAYGAASRAGLEAALLAAEGFDGPEAALDDPFGFWRAVPSARLGLRDMTDKLGSPFMIDGVEFKPYPACRFLHSTLQAVEEILRDGGPHREEVMGVTVHGASLLADEYHDIPRPRSGTDAQFSVPYTVAVLIKHGKIGPESYSDAAIKDPDVLDLVDRVRVVVDDEYDRLFPGKLSSRVEIVDKSGRRWIRTVPHPRGGPCQPMTWDETVAKLYSQCRPVMGEKSQELVDLVEHLAEVKDIRRITEFMRFDQRSLSEEAEASV